nr:hypothetical protein [Bacilli bacterium]
TYDNNNNNDYLRIYNYSLILEYFLSAPYGQLQYFDLKDNKAVPVYNNEKMDDKKKKNNEIIYKSVVKYFKYVKKSEEIVEDDSKNISFEIYRGVVETHLTDRSVKDKFSFVDSFNDSEEKNVFKIIDKY